MRNWGTCRNARCCAIPLSWLCPRKRTFTPRGEEELKQLATLVRSTVGFDAKRGDIGSTAEHYAREAFGRYGAHAVTVNPYLGTDSVAPFFEYGGGVIALEVAQALDPPGIAGPLQRLPIVDRVAP